MSDEKNREKSQVTMDPVVKTAICRRVEQEPFAKTMKMKLICLEPGRSVVEMFYAPEKMDNLFQRAHGGAIYALIDEAFETAGQTRGTVALALNVNVTYTASPAPGARLRAEAVEENCTRKTASFNIRVTDDDDNLIASCKALAYRTGTPLPFIP